VNTLSKRGQNIVSIVFIVGLLAMLGIAGAVETQDFPTCEDHQASQDWQAAWKNGCPFQDDNGNYLYTWTP
jgi:hypothetical protein